MEIVNEATDARVLRGFAFVDVCGFTHIIDRCGDASAVRSLSAFRRRVRDACGHHGVRVAKWLGDGAMIVGIEPERLARGVWEIIDAPTHGSPPIRAGFAFGEVLVFEGDDYIGRTVNLAARLCDVAQPGELIVARFDERWTMDSLPLRPRAPIAVRGFRVPVDVLSAASLDDGTVDRPPRAV